MIGHHSCFSLGATFPQRMCASIFHLGPIVSSCEHTHMHVKHYHPGSTFHVSHLSLVKLETQTFFFVVLCLSRFLFFWMCVLAFNFVCVCVFPSLPPSLLFLPPLSLFLSLPWYVSIQACGQALCPCASDSGRSAPAGSAQRCLGESAQLQNGA